MYLEVKEEFNLPVGDIYPYFESPEAWTKLYGLVKKPKKLKNGWYAISLHRFPFPLVAKVVESEPNKMVRWIFGGFWRGVGEVRFSKRKERTTVEGFEYVVPHGLWLLAPVAEKMLMEKEFTRIWNLGWKRIRKAEPNQ